ncbi:hypothetical protein [Endozoicomonas ascidiicola]|uniref:hypothetical protein n=1 Tax=Endozoicomonas ascidiicola TaxID=1698521 RepID=UPI00082CFCAF|nr:hypothetical protein [Endozoicomonas ascidiicola]
MDIVKWRVSTVFFAALAAWFNKNFKRTPAAPLKLALAAVFLPELQTCELFSVGSFFVQFYRKVQKKSVGLFLQAGVRVLSLIPSFMPASKSSFAVCFFQAGKR